MLANPTIMPETAVMMVVMAMITLKSYFRESLRGVSPEKKAHNKRHTKRLDWALA
jgi:hypothetical protein